MAVDNMEERPREYRSLIPEGKGGTIDPGLLSTVVQLAVQRLSPDQVILFGSAARGEMHEESDIDLLVLTSSGEPARKQHQWYIEERDKQVHILQMTSREVEAGRLVACDVRQGALEDGVTLYTREGVTPVQTADAEPETKEMIRKSLLSPEHSTLLMKRAKIQHREANRTGDEYDAAWTCEHAARCLEYCYKALLTSLGRRIKHTHDLNQLQDQCRTAGAGQPETQDKELLETVTEYNRDFQYREGPPEAESERTRDEIMPLVNQVYDYAVQHVPPLAEDTRARIDAETGACREAKANNPKMKR